MTGKRTRAHPMEGRAAAESSAKSNGNHPESQGASAAPRKCQYVYER